MTATGAWRDLVDLLACPSADHAALEVQDGPDGSTELVCTVCATRYPVREDIPVLLVDDAKPGPNGIGVPVTGDR